MKMSKRVAIFGASGLVGSELTLLLHSRPAVEVVPIVRSSGNTWRLIREGIRCQLMPPAGDLEKLERMLEGCTHVVNCTRGDDAVMLRGHEQLLEVSARLGSVDFVHLSSTTVYGDPPPRSAERELPEPPPPPRGTYGHVKWKQDAAVRLFARKGLRSSILCAPNFSGAHSYFLLGLVAALRSRQFVLIGDGDSRCNLVTTRNLALAIESALDHCTNEARRVFVTDPDPIDWLRLTSILTEGLPGLQAPESVSRAEALRLLDRASPRAERGSVLRSMKHLVSSDVRAAMRKDPGLAAVDRVLRTAVARLGSRTETNLRLAIEGPQAPPTGASEPTVATGLLTQQLRTVVHSSDAARSAIAYRPALTAEQGVREFVRCLRIEQGWNTANSDLALHLA